MTSLQGITFGFKFMTSLQGTSLAKIHFSPKITHKRLNFVHVFIFDNDHNNWSDCVRLRHFPNFWPICDGVALTKLRHFWLSDPEKMQRKFIGLARYVFLFI